jgi:putative sigma-54 modulation protein
MNINIKATNIELTPAIANYVHNKISTVEKYLPTSSEASDLKASIIANVEVGKKSQHHKSGKVFKAEVHLTGDGLDIYAVSDQDDLYAAIDVVKDEVVHNLVQLKDKRLTLARRGAELMKIMMKGLTGTTTRGFSWGVERLKFKNLRNFRKKR